LIIEFNSLRPSILYGFVKSPKTLFSSFRRKPESRNTKDFWTPAFAGVTTLMTFYEAVNLETFVKSG